MGIVKSNKKRKQRIIETSFKFFPPNKDFAYPILFFENVEDINIDEIFATVLYKDPETKEWVLFFIKKNEDFLVLHIPDAIAWLLHEKTKNSIILMNTKFENIDKADGKILPFGREFPEK